MAKIRVRFLAQWSKYNPGDEAAFDPPLAKKLTTIRKLYGLPDQPPLARVIEDIVQPVADLIIPRMMDEGNVSEKSGASVQKNKGSRRRRDGTSAK